MTFDEIAARERAASKAALEGLRRLKADAEALSRLKVERDYRPAAGSSVADLLGVCGVWRRWITFAGVAARLNATING